MKKDYSSYDGNKTSKLLEKELFYIEIDKLASMALHDDFSTFTDNFEGKIFDSTHSDKTRIYANVYNLVKLYEGGHNIRLVYHDDIGNLYNLIHRHLHNVNNMFNRRVNQIRPAELEGLEVLGMLADEVMNNNQKHLNKERQLEIKEQQNFFKPIGVTASSLRSRFQEYAPRRNELTQHDVVLKKAKMKILDEF